MYRLSSIIYTNNGDKMLYYINVFLIYSMIGFLMETSLKTFFFHHMNNGTMYGPWIPVYGLGCCLIIVCMRFVFNRIKVNRLSKVCLFFLLSTLTLTLLELIGGVFIEAISGKVFWDYSDLKYNFGHYIALEISLIWGVLSLLIIYVMKPFIDKIIKKIPKYLTYLVLILFILDLCFSIYSLA